jgi:energy-coupling factor transporter transmembrane protein EcfT
VADVDTMSATNGPAELQRALERKQARRRLMAAAPFPEKIAVVVQLQARFAPILRARGQEYRVWRLESPGQMKREV